MTTRRNLLRLAGAVPAAALLTACSTEWRGEWRGGRGPGRPAHRADIEWTELDRLPDRGPPCSRPRPRGSGHRRLVDRVRRGRRRRHAGGTCRPQDRGTTYDVGVAGALDARVASTGGYLVALATGTSQRSTPDRPLSARRAAETTIVVVGAEGERNRLTLPGCVEPEAFSIAGDRLFVLDYLPPQAPERYRVRQVDLVGGRVHGAVTRNTKTLIPPGAEEEMRGRGPTGRVRARHGTCCSPSIRTSPTTSTPGTCWVAVPGRASRTSTPSCTRSASTGGSRTASTCRPRSARGPASAHAIALSTRRRRASVRGRHDQWHRRPTRWRTADGRGRGELRGRPARRRRIGHAEPGRVAGVRRYGRSRWS